MKKFRVIILMALTLITGSISAKSVVFTLSDGTQVYYLIGGGSNPIMTFENGSVTVNSDTYQISDIVNFYISNTDDPSGVSEQKDSRSSFKMQGETLYVGSSSKEVKVYGINGVEQEVEVSVIGDVTAVGIANLPAGNYVVKVGKTSFKFNKKK